NPSLPVTTNPLPEPLLLNAKVAPVPEPVNATFEPATEAMSRVKSARAAGLKQSPSMAARANANVLGLVRSLNRFPMLKLCLSGWHSSTLSTSGLGGQSGQER